MTGHPDPKDIFIIANPVSGLPGLRRKALGWLRAESGIPWNNIIFTRYPRHATEIAKGLVEKGARYVFALGGDGTANEVAAGLLVSDTVFGVIPTGSGNGIAHMLKTPSSPQEIFRKLPLARIERIDAGKAGERIFLATSGIGFSAVVAERFDVFGVRGAMPYFWIAVTGFFRKKNSQIILRVDGGEPEEKELFELTVANGPEFGNGAVIAPDASLVDGLFDVVMFRKPSLLSALSLAVHLFRGTISRHPCIRHFRARKVEISTVDGGNILFHVDGDPVLNESCEIVWEIYPAALKVLKY